LGPFEIAKNLRGYREFATTARSERVARTEMTVAQNQGNLQQFRQAGVEGKRWWTAEDERTRETHLDAHGQTVQLSEMFQVGLDAMDGPGQGSDPAENINCRCVVIPPARDWRPGDVKEKQPAESKIPLTDKGTIDINAFQPQVKRVAGVPNAAVETAQNATRQTIQSLRPEVAKKLIKLVHDSKRRTTVVKANSRHLTRQGEGCVGVYKHTEDATWVSGYHSYFATHHELGHQLTARTGRLAEILGKKKAPQFMAEIEERFKMVQLGKATPVTEYSTKSVKEYIAEAFKYAITDPKKVRDTDPITLKIMRKYFVKEDPVKFTHVPGFMGPIRALLGNLIKMEVPA
jgi:SPP1 gp7 family putative phage head morphogenesis protein